MKNFLKQSQHPYLSEVQPGLKNKLLWNEAIQWNERKWFKTGFSCQSRFFAADNKKIIILYIIRWLPIRSAAKKVRLA